MSVAQRAKNCAASIINGPPNNVRRWPGLMNHASFTCKKLGHVHSFPSEKMAGECKMGRRMEEEQCISKLEVPSGTLWPREVHVAIDQCCSGSKMRDLLNIRQVVMLLWVISVYCTVHTFVFQRPISMA